MSSFDMASKHLRKGFESIVCEGDDIEDIERLQQIKSFFKFVIFYFSCPAMLVLAVADRFYQEHSASLMHMMRLGATVFMALVCLQTLRQKNLFWTQVWATLTGACGYFAIHFMFYYRGDSESHFIYALLPALVIVATGIRVTWLFYFLNCALIILPTVFIGYVISSGNPGPMYYVNISNWILVFAFCTSGRWFFEKIYRQERILRLALRNETRDRERLLSQSINDLIHGHNVSDILVEKVPNLVQEWEALTSKLQFLKEKEAEIISSKRLAEQARQVAHDIRSPLSALSLITESLNELPEEKRTIVKAASTRINDIANELLSIRPKHTSDQADIEDSSAGEVLMLPALLDQLASEKRAQYRMLSHIQIQTELNESYGAFILFQKRDLMRMISNIVDNAVEALRSSGGIVTISAKTFSGSVQLSIVDNGIGMSPETLQQVGRKGFSFGKESGLSGTGLGLYHAKKVIREGGGKLEIQSTLGVGTKIDVLFERATAPEWFLRNLDISQTNEIIILDDDQSIHHVWSSRFSNFVCGQDKMKIIKFSSPMDFAKYVGSSVYINRSLFLVDFKMISHKENGLEMINQLGISASSVLVTSHWDEHLVQLQCNMHGCKLLPKPLVGLVPILNGISEKEVGA